MPYGNSGFNGYTQGLVNPQADPDMGVGLTNALVQFQNGQKQEQDDQYNNEVKDRQRKLWEQTDEDRERTRQSQERQRRAFVDYHAGPPSPDQPGLVAAHQVQTELMDNLNKHHPESPQNQAANPATYDLRGEENPDIGAGNESLGADGQPYPEVGIGQEYKGSKKATGAPIGVAPVTLQGNEKAKGIAASKTDKSTSANPTVVDGVSAAAGKIADPKNVIGLPATAVSKYNGTYKAMKQAIADATAEHDKLEKSITSAQQKIAKKYGYGTDSFDEKAYYDEMHDVLTVLQPKLEKNQDSLNQLSYKITENKAALLGPQARQLIMSGDIEGAAKMYDEEGLDAYAASVRKMQVGDGFKVTGRKSEAGIPYVHFGDTGRAVPYHEFLNSLTLNGEKAVAGPDDAVRRGNTTIINASERAGHNPAADNALRRTEALANVRKYEALATNETNPKKKAEYVEKARQNKDMAESLKIVETPESKEQRISRRDAQLKIANLKKLKGGDYDKSARNLITMLEAQQNLYPDTNWSKEIASIEATMKKKPGGNPSDAPKPGAVAAKRAPAPTAPGGAATTSTTPNW